MLLIFDLDDTLIPTSDVLTPKRLEQAVRKMIELGFPVAYEEGRERLFAMNQKALYSKDALREFLQMFGREENEVVLAVLDGSLEGLELRKVEEMNHLVRQFKGPKAIVTAGNPKLQQEKVDRFGIDRSLFTEVVVAEKGKKGEVYDRLQKQFGAFVVVGDRIKEDLSSAKQLGGITIHIRQGRGKNEPLAHPDVDYEINHIDELKGILETLYSEGFKN